jgi:sugar phosphate isomerase/epimerase
MELATSLNMMFDSTHESPHRALKRLVDAGFRVFDFNFCDWTFDGADFAGPQWQEWITDIGRWAGELGVRFSQGHGPCDITRTPEQQARKTLLSHRSIEAAATLHIPWLVFHVENTPGPFDRAHFARLKEANVALYTDLLATASDAGVGIALENSADFFAQRAGSPRSYGSTPAELADLADALDHPSVGVCWDTGHARLQRLDQPASIRALGSRLKALHVQDTDGASDQHLVPFLGDIDWKPIIAALADIGYRGDFTYEAHRFIQRFPDAMRDAAATFAARVGEGLLRQPV